LVSNVFFKADDLEPENLFQLLTENLWKGAQNFYSFLLWKAIKKPGLAKKVLLREFSEEYVNQALLPHLQATKNILRVTPTPNVFFLSNFFVC